MIEDLITTPSAVFDKVWKSDKRAQFVEYRMRKNRLVKKRKIG